MTPTLEEQVAAVLPCECYSRHSRGEVRHWPHCLIHARAAILALIREREREMKGRCADLLWQPIGRGKPLLDYVRAIAEADRIVEAAFPELLLIHASRAIRALEDRND